MILLKDNFIFKLEISSFLILIFNNFSWKDIELFSYFNLGSRASNFSYSILTYKFKERLIKLFQEKKIMNKKEKKLSKAKKFN